MFVNTQADTMCPKGTKRILFCLLLFLTAIYTYFEHFELSAEDDCRYKSWCQYYTSNTRLLNSSTNETIPEQSYIKEISPPGVLLKVHGGIGNQLFQYACSYALARKLGLDLYLFDPGYPKDMTKFRNVYVRGFQLQYFNIPAHNLINRDTVYSQKDVFPFNDSQLLMNQIPKDCIKFKFLKHEDFCQGEIFFEPFGPELREMFEMKINEYHEEFEGIKPWLDQIQSVGNGSVAVHIRRGDYTMISGITPISYQKNAMKMMSQKLKDEPKMKFFVFSDDIAFAKTELGNFSNVVFVSSNKTSNLEEFYLMTKCSHFIVTNSTFSWWAAYLIKNRRKIIIGPKFLDEFFDHYNSNPYKKDFKRFVINNYWYPPSWIIIDP